jgi:hypothetical protein
MRGSRKLFLEAISRAQRFKGSSSAKEYEVASNEIGISRKVGVSQTSFVPFSCLFGAFMTVIFS